MRKLATIEEERKILVPKVYKDFYELCAYYTPENLVGTDLLNKYPDELQDWAVDLLEENKIGNFLKTDDLAFYDASGVCILVL